jgi:periplasmic protein TonB
LALILIASAGSLLPQEISHTTEPRVIHTVQPEYTKEALDAKLQGTVLLTALIGVDGIPSDIKMTRRLGKGLDEKALECVERWRFSPGTNHGEPSPMKVKVEINFRLPQPPPADN